MTATAVDVIEVVTGAGVALTQAIPGYFFSDAQVRVWRVETVDGVTTETALALGVDFTISKALNDNRPRAYTGTITTTAAVTALQKIAVMVWPLNEQTTDFSALPHNPADYEKQHDLSAIRDQSLLEILKRSPRLPLSVSGDQPLIEAPVAGRLLIARADLLGWENGPNADEIAAAQGYAVAAGLYKDDAETAAGLSAAALASFLEKYLGAYVDDAAATAAAGGAPITGALYWNTTSNLIKVYDGASWVLQTVVLGDGDVTEPKLAGSLALTLSQSVADLTALRGVDLTRYQTFEVRDLATGGNFHRRTGDQSSLVVVKSVSTTTANIGTDELTSAAHGLYTTDVVIATSTVAGVTAETLYWVIRTGANTFKLATSHADCLAGTPVVDITATTAITFKHLRDPLQGVYIIPTGAALDGSGGIIERHRGQADERSWWPATNAGLQSASDFANKLLFRAGSENATKIFVKHASTIWEGEGMFASIVNFTHTSGYGIVNVLAGSGSLQNNFVIRAMQVNGASLTSSGGIIRAEDFGYSHFDEVYFFGVQVNQTWALDVRSTWPQGTYYCTVTNCIFGLMQFGIYLGDGGNNNLIAHNRFQQASPGGGQCITLDGSAPGYISSTLLLANITELPGNVTTGIYVGAAVDGLTIIAHRYESMLTGLIVASGAKHVQNINPYYEGCTTKVNNASRGLIFNQVAAASWYGVTGIIEYANPFGGTPTRASVGLYRFTFTAALAHANFVAVVNGTAVHTKIVGQTTTYVDVECLNASHARVDADLINLTVYMAT